MWTVISCMGRGCLECRDPSDEEGEGKTLNIFLRAVYYGGRTWGRPFLNWLGSYRRPLGSDVETLLDRVENQRQTF